MNIHPPVTTNLEQQVACCKTDLGALFTSPIHGNCLIIALSDIDGTINDESLPESRRLESISPAKQAVEKLERIGIRVGICTARSTGEAQIYAQATGGTGFLISENGATTVMPDGSTHTIGSITEISECLSAINTRLGRTVVNTTDVANLERAWEIQKTARTSATSHLLQPHECDLGHETLAALQLSAQRFASAYISGLNPSERGIAIQIAKEYGLKPFGDLLHLISPRADKGIAINALCERLRGTSTTIEDSSRRTITIDKVIPIVFGNGENDLPLFEVAIQAGGVGVLVADAVKEGGFHFDIRSKPPHPETIITHGKANGFGILASIPHIHQYFMDKYKVALV